MRRGIAVRLRSRRPIALIAAWLIVLQAFFAGLAMAQAAVVLTSDATDFAVICHGNGGSDSDHGAVPDPIKAAHLCCVACDAGGSPATLALAPLAPGSLGFRILPSPSIFSSALPVNRRALRDGPSQAPPTFA